MVTQESTHETIDLNDVVTLDARAAMPTTTGGSANVPLEAWPTAGLLKVSTAARALGLHKRTVYDWIGRGLVEVRYLPSGVTLVVMASVVKEERPVTSRLARTAAEPRVNSSVVAA